jgi:hypothetical protein
LPRNSSGTYSLPQAPFVPGSVISSAAVNSDFADIATALTGSVASNGVTTITGQLKSSVTATPAYSSSVDLTTGFGVSVSGTAAIYAGGSIVGTFTSSAAALTIPLSITGDLTVSGSITAASFNFSGTGAIQIPAGTTAQRPASPVIGDIRYNSTNGNFEGTPDATRWDPMSQANTRFSLSASVASNLLTVSVLNALTGAAPTAADPVTIFFSDVTGGAGDLVPVLVTSALSINTNGVGASLGSSNTVPFRFWVVAFNNSGTAVLGLINCSNATQVFPLSEINLVSSTAISNSATSAGVFYTPNGVTVSSAPFTILGLLEYNAGLATAGTYGIVPTRLTPYRLGMKLPGDIVQAVYVNTATGGSGGLTVSITPTSTINLVLVNATQVVSAAAGLTITARLDRGATGLGQSITFGSGGAAITTSGSISFVSLDAPATASSQAYSVVATSGSGTFSGGTMTLQEIMG